MDRLQIRAHAKVNLALDVVKRLPNGYHQVRMIMQTLGLSDVLTVEKRKAPGIEIVTDSGVLPTDENNLIYKAARLMMEHYDVREGVSFYLEKHIPIAAGMAGGSTDAAAAMKGINELFGLNATLEELQALGVKIGADVPYCLMGGTALAEGIGEELTALPPMPPCFLVVAKPGISVSTKYVYEHLDAAGIDKHPEIDGMVEAIRKGSLCGVTERMENVLEQVTAAEYAVIGDLKCRLLELGAKNSLMSGSGPTVFGVFTDRETAKQACDRMKEEGLAKDLFVTEPVSL